MESRIRILTAILTVTFLTASCSTGNNPEPINEVAGRSVSLEGLSLLDGSMLDVDGSASIRVDWSGDGSTAMILADKVVDLRALYFSLDHKE